MRGLKEAAWHSAQRRTWAVHAPLEALPFGGDFVSNAVDRCYIRRCPSAKPHIVLHADLWLGVYVDADGEHPVRTRCRTMREPSRAEQHMALDAVERAIRLHTVYLICPPVCRCLPGATTCTYPHCASGPS